LSITSTSGRLFAPFAASRSGRSHAAATASAMSVESRSDSHQRQRCDALRVRWSTRSQRSVDAMTIRCGGGRRR
jgi:hypothetical protein